MSMIPNEWIRRIIHCKCMLTEGWRIFTVLAEFLWPYVSLEINHSCVLYRYFNVILAEIIYSRHILVAGENSRRKKTTKWGRTTQASLTSTAQDWGLMDMCHIYPKVCIHGFISRNYQRKIVNIFLPIILSICFGCSKEVRRFFWVSTNNICFGW